MSALRLAFFLLSAFWPSGADDSSVLVNEVLNDETVPGVPEAPNTPSGWGEVDLPVGFSVGTECQEIETKLANTIRQVLEGFVHGVMSKLANQEELQCIKEVSGCIVSDLLTASERAVRQVRSSLSAVKHGGAVDGVFEVVLETGKILNDLMLMVLKLISRCFQKDAIDMLNATAHHFISLSYVKKRLVINLVPMTVSLADATQRWAEKNYGAFGYDLGFTIRKILLSDAKGTGPRSLPEGMPVPAVLQQVAEGVSAGFFVNGSDIEVVNEADPSAHNLLSLKSCIADDIPFFRAAFNAVWVLFAQIQNRLKEKDMRREGAELTEQPLTVPFAANLAEVLAQLPLALAKCNMSFEHSDMFINAFRSLRSLRIQPEIPIPISQERIATRVAKASEFWDKHEFRQLGVQMGNIFRDLLLMVYESKYEIDDSGRLREVIQQKSSLFQKVDQESELGTMFMVCGMALVFAMLGAVFYRAANPVKKAECRSLCQARRGADAERMLVPAISMQESQQLHNVLLPASVTEESLALAPAEESLVPSEGMAKTSVEALQHLEDVFNASAVEEPLQPVTGPSAVMPATVAVQERMRLVVSC